MKRIALGLFLLLAPAPAFAQPRSTIPNPAEPNRQPDEIGSWIVVCPDSGKVLCRLRHRVWIVAPAGRRPVVALEVLPRHGIPVPALAVHGVTIPEVAGAILALGIDATIQFGAEPPIQLACEFAQDRIACAPNRADAPAAAVQLRQAKSAVIRLHLPEPAKSGLPITASDQVRSLELARTGEALSRIQPSGAAADNRWDAADILHWLAHQFGFPGGRAEFLRWLLGQAASLRQP